MAKLGWYYAPKALNDLLDYARQLSDAVQLLREFPNAGRSDPHLKPGRLLLHVGSHRMIYRVKADQIEIVRILHQSMNLPRHI